MKKSALFDFDPCLTSTVRLAIVSALIGLGEAEFSDLKTLLNVTQGNLSVHANKLEESGYIKITKQFSGKKPLTLYKLTADGKKAFLHHVNKLKKIVRDTDT